MSKVWEDEVIRDADTTEQTDIEKNGGGSSRFELVKTFEINSPIISKSFELNNYDEVVLEIKATGTASTNMYVALYSGDNYFTTSVASFFTTSERTEYIRFFRLTPYLFEVNQGGQVSLIRNYVLPNVLRYDEKITKVTIGIAGTGNKMESGIIKIYGRNLTNE